MKRRIVLLPCTTLLAGWLLLAGQAQGQPINRPGGVIGPPVSPYLNLFRQGSPTSINYYDLVRPQFQTQTSLLALQGQVNTLGTQVASGTQAAGAFPDTGHPVQFFNYSHYFSSGRLGQLTTARPPSPAISSAPSSRPPAPIGSVGPRR
jgi:hypothetical protein